MFIHPGVYLFFLLLTVAVYWTLPARRPEWRAWALTGASLLAIGLMALTGCEDLAFWEAFESLDADWNVQNDHHFRQALDKYGPELLESTRTPGAVVVLLQDGEIAWAKALGEANSETGEALRSCGVPM